MRGASKTKEKVLLDTWGKKRRVGMQGGSQRLERDLGGTSPRGSVKGGRVIHSDGWGEEGGNWSPFRENTGIALVLVWGLVRKILTSWKSESMFHMGEAGCDEQS